jgi:hypothetical protein
VSATKRGSSIRAAYDDYSSFRWNVDRLLEAVDPPGGAWLEPCAGAGTIIEAVNAKRNDVTWAAVEIQAKYEAPLRKLIPSQPHVAVGDFLALPIEPRPYPPLFSVAITNPPFSLAQQFIEKCRKLAGVTAMLLRVNLLGSVERAEWLNSWYPDVYVLPNRPNFNPTLKKDKNGNDTMSSGDSIEYAWMVWDWRRIGPRGTVQGLAVTPEDVRAAELLPRTQAARAAALTPQPGAPTAPASEDVTRPETPGAKAP